MARGSWLLIPIISKHAFYLLPIHYSSDYSTAINNYLRVEVVFIVHFTINEHAVNQVASTYQPDSQSNELKICTSIANKLTHVKRTSSLARLKRSRFYRLRLVPHVVPHDPQQTCGASEDQPWRTDVHHRRQRHHAGISSRKHAEWLLYAASNLTTKVMRATRTPLPHWCCFILQSNAHR